MNMMGLKKSIAYGFVNAILLAALSLALVKVSGMWGRVESFAFDLTLILLLSLLSCGLLFFSVFAWRYILGAVHQGVVAWRASLMHTCFMVAGKYIPGKVWGVVIRAATSKACGVGGSEIVVASVFEQLLTIFVALGFGLALVLGSVHWGAGLGLMVALVLFGYVFFFYFLCGIESFLNFLHRHSIALNFKVSGQRLPFDAFFPALVLILCQWMIIAGVLYCIALSQGVELELEGVMGLVGGYMLAVLAGFLALIAPGGIGVREGVFVSMAIQYIPLDQAVQLAFLLRFWNVLYDICAAFIGGAIFVFWQRRNYVAGI
jgi:hypothetical protein